MKYVRTCASTASPQLPSGVELGKRSIKSIGSFLLDLIYNSSRDVCIGLRLFYPRFF
ncbi:hypothetical protein [Candidatus Sarmatiella mevalonica]|uniref:hypothetical protein n=1 Tax=Candidatus Sarmatiella mevalonica TaxID=2770581 RepID=UPI001921D7E0|nr:hypothetical protein [Candidatus Sarmatiella mevalonica]